jgi:oleate hydratase
VTFTVTDTGTEFVNQIAALTGSEAGLGGLVTLKDSGWVLSLSIFHQPEIVANRPGPASGGAMVSTPIALAISCENP